MSSHFVRLVAGIVATVGVALASLPSAHAIVRFGQPDQNYIAPTGEYASIPWGKIGLVDDLTPEGVLKGRNPAWAISPNWALRANHVTGNSTGYDIVQNGVAHRVVESISVGATDLQLVRVEQPFSSFFNMYQGSDEIGKEMVMFGTSNPSKTTQVFSEPRPGVPSRFNGWNLDGTRPAGQTDEVSWGRNRVLDFARVENTNTLYATFDAPTLPDGSINPNSVGDDESIAYSGDSGGGVFLQENGEWRLAGIVYAVDAAFYSQNTPASQPLLGAIFDARDLWTDVYIDPNNPAAGTRRELITGDDPVPYGTYSSRISQYRNSIDTITGQTAGLGSITVPEAGTGQLALLGAGCLGVGIGIIRRRRAN